MKPNSLALRAALVAAAALTVAPAARAAAVLYEQASLQFAGAMANGTDGQALLLSETFAFSGTASSLSWWGTAGSGFDVSLTVGNGTSLVFLQPPVASTPAGFTVMADVDSVIDADGNLHEEEVEVFRYTIDLGALSGGTYTLAIRDTASDALQRTWFWLHGAQRDGPAQSVDPDAGTTTPNSFDLSLRVEGERSGTVPEPASLGLALCALVAGGCLRRRVCAPATRIG